MDTNFDIKAIYKETEELLRYLQITFKNRMNCQIFADEDGFYINIKLLSDSNTVLDQIATSASLITASNKLKTENYEKKILNEIQNMEDEEIWISGIFLYINQLPKRERHYIIATYFLNEEIEQLMSFLNVKTRTLKQIKSKSITHLGMLVPGNLRIKEK
mgnify:CR=1 FL=1